MRLLFNTPCSNDCFDGLQAALVDMTPDLIRTIWRRFTMFKEIIQRDGSLAYVEFYDYSVDWLADMVEDVELPHGESHVEVPDSIDYTGVERCRTDGPRMVLYDTAFYWEALAGDLHVETYPIEYETIRKLAGETTTNQTTGENA